MVILQKENKNASTKAILEQLKNRRLKQLTADEKKWQDIMYTAQKRIDELHDRHSLLKAELEKVKSMPSNISTEKERLLKLINENKKQHEIIASKLKETEHKANETNKVLKLEEVKLNELREDRIRIEGIIKTQNETIKQLSSQVKERLAITLEELFNLAKI